VVPYVQDVGQDQKGRQRKKNGNPCALNTV